ncbi:MAG: PorT family protein [Hymenobacter sp.]|nr:MAG: PorT family protein [Hymenobacter sp.]
MKKVILTVAAMTLAPAAFAQVEIGLKISPSISSLRTDSPALTSFSSENAKFSFGGGIFMDYFFGENYAFNTGLFLTGKGGTISYSEPIVGTTTRLRVSQKIAIQYLELPLTVKLFTNEVAPDTRIYFQLGGSLAVPVQTRINGDKYYTDPYDNNNQTKAGSHVFDIDANLIGGFGAEYQLGKSTKVLAGFSYHHGLIDTDRYFEKTRNFTDVNIKNNVFALDLGLKF